MHLVVRETTIFRREKTRGNFSTWRNFVENDPRIDPRLEIEKSIIELMKKA